MRLPAGSYARGLAKDVPCGRGAGSATSVRMSPGKGRTSGALSPSRAPFPPLRGRARSSLPETDYVRAKPPASSRTNTPGRLRQYPPQRYHFPCRQASSNRGGWYFGRSNGMFTRAGPFAGCTPGPARAPWAQDVKATGRTGRMPNHFSARLLKRGRDPGQGAHNDLPTCPRALLRGAGS